MSDLLPGEVVIGGPIPRRLLNKLAGMVAHERVGIDWQGVEGHEAIRQAIEMAAAAGQTVRFMYRHDDGTRDQDKEIPAMEMVSLLCTEMAGTPAPARRQKASPMKEGYEDG